MKLIDFDKLNAKCKEQYLRYDKNFVFSFLFEIYDKLKSRTNITIENMSINKLMCVIAVLKEREYHLMEKNMIPPMKEVLVETICNTPENLLTEDTGHILSCRFSEGSIFGENAKYFTDAYDRTIQILNENYSRENVKRFSQIVSGHR